MRKELPKGFSSSRRLFLHNVAPMLALPLIGGRMGMLFDKPGRGDKRDYSVCLNPDIILEDSDLLDVLVASGVNAVWIATYFYGYWPYPVDKIALARQRIINKGLLAFALTVPLGHPGDSLNADSDDFPLIPPAHWPRSVGIDGKAYAGTSVGEIVNIENAKALKELSQMGFKQCILDDDFRIARGPGVIGGSFDTATCDRFLKRGGYSNHQWDELLQNIRDRQLTNLLRDWVNWHCDQMTHSFRLQQRAFKGDLGIMVMDLGAEKAGIRFADFSDITMRVGEGHFSDKSFSTPKGWTDELFSVLFHRRFVKPDKAWSETTAFPADALSALNMSAKLTVSTIADVRHTAIMSGLTPIPKDHWAMMSTAMRTQKKYHEKIAGHQPRGPLKHFWGEASRYVGRDKPFSLWLALGIPFEVIEKLEQGREGWVFMADEDYHYLNKNAGKRNWVVREDVKKASDEVFGIKENLDALWIWRRSIITQLKKSRIPYILEEQPAVCAWYPEASCILVWNLSSIPVGLTVQIGGQIIRKDYKPLESQLLIL